MFLDYPYFHVLSLVSLQTKQHSNKLQSDNPREYSFMQSYKKTKTAPSDTSNKNGTQQKRHPLILFENNDTLQKWHMTNTPPEIDKYDTHKIWCLTKVAHLAKKCPEVIDSLFLF